MKTHKGKELDINRLLADNSKVRAAGNIPVNARGDLLGRRGKILKTREQLENEYFKNHPDAAKQKNVGLNADFAEFKKKIMEREIERDLATAEEVVDPYKLTAEINPNLSTKKNQKVKFTDISKNKNLKDELDDLDFADNEFEVIDEENEVDTDMSTPENEVKRKKG